MKVRRCCHLAFENMISLQAGTVSFVFYILLWVYSDQNEQMSNNLTNFQIEWLLSSLCVYVCSYLNLLAGF